MIADIRQFHVVFKAIVWFSMCWKDLNHHLSQRKVETEGMSKAKPSLIDRAYSDLRDWILFYSARDLLEEQANCQKEGSKVTFWSHESQKCHIRKRSSRIQLRTFGLKMLFVENILETAFGHWYNHKTRTKVDLSDEWRFDWGGEFLTV